MVKFSLLKLYITANQTTKEFTVIKEGKCYNLEHVSEASGPAINVKVLKIASNMFMGNTIYLKILDKEISEGHQKLIASVPVCVKEQYGSNVFYFPELVFGKMFKNYTEIEEESLAPLATAKDTVI